MPDPEDAETDHELMVELRHLAVATERWRHRVARESLGVGQSELAALGSIAARGALTPTEIADRLLITTASATQLIDRLVHDDLAARRPHDSDRRKVLIDLTDRGHRVTTALRDRLAEVARRHAEQLSAGERTVVLRYLREVADDLDGLGDP